jgi:FMN phosphatase YigB (HAD superfamily)
MTQLKSVPLKVGFDLDGVLLYNPLRIIRPLIALLKKKQIGIERKELEFFVPRKRWEEIMWEMFHRSSLFIAPGYKRITQLKKQNLIEPYLITGRFAHLNQDFERWKKRMKADDLFVGTYLNLQDEQPHVFKERMIKELDLDIFIEDNWDIVKYLAEQLANKKIFWISNLFDRQQQYQYKFLSLNAALDHLETLIPEQ